jgi:hypothetical protein
MLADWTFSLQERVERLPPWAQPPFQGVLFVYGLMLAKGAAVLVPLALLVAVVLGGWRAALRVVGVVLAVGLAGFAGGLAWSLVHPPSRWLLGRLGRYPAWWAAAFGYFLVLLPAVSAVAPGALEDFDLADPRAWIALVVVSLFFGSLLARWFAEDEAEPQPREASTTRRRRGRRRKPASF